MKYSKIFLYAYLAFAALFLYDGINKYINNQPGFYISFGLAALAIFMYFFRKKFMNKYNNNSDNSK